MSCPTCQTSNEPDARYCEQCGSELVPMTDAATVFFDPSGPDGVALVSGGTATDSALLELARRELAADYEVQHEVGRGGMAIVYRAIETRLRRPVALKVLPPELALGPTVVERFGREAQMAASLDHPNIIPIYRVGQSGALLFLAMRYVEGRALDSVIAGQRALPIPVVLLILRSAAAALTYAHENGIVHRDIKGGNILIDTSGRVIVTDFGVARAIENASMTTTGSVIGTPYFMSPEQCAGNVAGPQSDQYSLGVVAFQMLTGTVPFHAETLAAIMHHHFFTPVPDVRAARDDVSPELAAVLDRMLQKDPAQRFATTREMMQAIEAIPLSDADRIAGETMLRELAQGGSVRQVRTSPLPPLADTMQIVAAHDALRKSVERTKVRRRVALGLAAVAGVLALVWAFTRTPHPAPVAPVVATAPAPAPPAVVAVTSPPAPHEQRPKAAAPPKAESVAGPKPDSTAVPAVVSTGKLRLRVVPSDATILVDGRELGRGVVVDSELPAGERKLEVSAAGYRTFDTTFTIQAGVTTYLPSVILKAAGDQ
jgi:hypothetical protein